MRASVWSRARLRWPRRPAPRDHATRRNRRTGRPGLARRRPPGRGWAAGGGLARAQGFPRSTAPPPRTLEGGRPSFPKRRFNRRAPERKDSRAAGTSHPAMPRCYGAISVVVGGSRLSLTTLLADRLPRALAKVVTQIRLTALGGPDWRNDSRLNRPNRRRGGLARWRAAGSPGCQTCASRFELGGRGSHLSNPNRRDIALRRPMGTRQRMRRE
jgi:hypothetical protein